MVERQFITIHQPEIVLAGSRQDSSQLVLRPGWLLALRGRQPEQALGQELDQPPAAIIAAMPNEGLQQAALAETRIAVNDRQASGLTRCPGQGFEQVGMVTGEKIFVVGSAGGHENARLATIES